MDRSQFKFKTQVNVRNYEIDWQGIVHNANYLLYCEIGRVEYLQHVGLKLDINTIQHASRVVVARNEIDYLSSARFGEMIDVYTRISSIRNSSFIFEGLLSESTSGRQIAANVSIHVWLNDITNKPMLVPDEFRRKVQAFEGKSSQIHWPGMSV